ncbi:CBS domain-containing protein [Paenibacillus pectinilyticus]|uniref:CBS domain-containing protein n=1 Tax=Paenibacillus pectinilyticus TaxID=512399 RepID=A0A1C1A4I5_9BACL|nr:CBS domain-containing protein [Paenibacillus pectinilyticus]OCT15464.1 CBS domain-containing protein [Paenibacillus pectinilyticus]
MKAHEIMVRQVYKVKEDDPIRVVIEKFIKYRISGLPVVNDRNEVVAYLSDGDIMRHIGKHDDHVFDSYFYTAVFKGDNEEFEERVRNLLPLNVMRIARKKVITVDVNEDIENIAAILGKKRIKKLPVVNQGALVGIISRGDVIRHSFQSIL